MDSGQINQVNDILTDVSFKNGFGVMGIRNGCEGVPEENVVNNSDYTVYNRLDYGGGAPGTYRWRLAQWGTKEINSFVSADNYTYTDEGGGRYLYENRAKRVEIDTSAGSVTLALDTSEEYDAPRAAGQLWPHLLIEQVFAETGKQTALRGVRKVRMKFTVEVSECERLMSEEEYDPSLHAAQCSWYITLNSTREGCRDYIWFGLPIFDNRSAGKFLGGTIGFDNGLSTGTGMLIYGLSGEAFLEKGVGVGDCVSADIDVLPYLRDALQEAQKRGLFQDHTLSDFAIGSTNFGWEVPGTFRSGMKISGLGLILE